MEVTSLIDPHHEYFRAGVSNLKTWSVEAGDNGQ